MTRTPTLLGVPQEFEKPPGGRYRVRAPDAPQGSVLRVLVRENTTTRTEYVEVICSTDRRFFINSDGDLTDFFDWEYATREEVKDFRFAQLVSKCADDVDLRGAAKLSAKLRELAVCDRDRMLRFVAAKLIARGKRGKAQQVLAYLGER